MNSPVDPSAKLRERQRIHINGIVQGVGFRPFVFRIANDLHLAGSVANNSEGVVIEVEGASETIQRFLKRLETELPAVARITSCNSEVISPVGGSDFEILTSQHTELTSAFISPDISICDDCLREFSNPKDRRYHYPFTNCTNCGPRYTIVERIPYDRPYTSMRVFSMCPECQNEYDNPSDRRFHAQPNGCPKCGPRLVLQTLSEKIVSTDPIPSAIELLSDGKILALRGIGGFHLAVDARNQAAVVELRRRKGRAEKPFALMARNLETVRQFCSVSLEEQIALEDRRRPIVLLHRTASRNLADAIAPGQSSLGFMLPYTPLHHALLAGKLDVLVMTSGNFSEEPIATANDEALDRLTTLADYFLLHDREILQRCDDSIVRVMASKPRVVRRSRGYVPEPMFLKSNCPAPGLAVGGELKSCIGLTRGNAVFLSQHIGDLDNLSAYHFFEASIDHLKTLLEIEPEFIAHDLHPEYLSTTWARQQSGKELIAVQHHHAHLASVLAERGIEERCMGIILDGTGYGTDGTIWGGELLIGNAETFDRVAWLAPIQMPGGEAAIKEPWRMAVSYLKSAYGEEFRTLDLPVVKFISASLMTSALTMIDRGINCPMTSSCGRLFDGVASILGISQAVTFEAQAAMAFEALSGTPTKREIYADVLEHQMVDGPIAVGPLIRRIVEDIIHGVSISVIGARFHATLAEVFIALAVHERKERGLNRVALSGGVYQNQLFFEYMLNRLEEEQFEVLTHEQVPTNDGGLALGQLAVAHARLLARTGI